MMKIYRLFILCALYLSVIVLLSQCNAQHLTPDDSVAHPSTSDHDSVSHLPTSSRSSFSLYDVERQFDIPSTNPRDTLNPMELAPPQQLYRSGGFTRAAWFIVIVTVIPFCCCCAIVYAFYQLCCGGSYASDSFAPDSSGGGIPGCNVS
jgi:hypothetical protein